MFNPLGDYDLSMLRKRIDTLAKAQELRDPIRRFAGESQSRIEQGLLMLQRGIGSKEILRRWAIYKKLVKLRKARKRSGSRQRRRPSSRRSSRWQGML